MEERLATVSPGTPVLDGIRVPGALASKAISGPQVTLDGSGAATELKAAGRGQQDALPAPMSPHPGHRLC